MGNIATSLEKFGMLSELSNLLDSVLKTEPKALTFIIAAGNKFTKESLDPLLTKVDIPVSGGIFHKIIYKDKLLDIGSIIIAWHKDISITNYKNIENIDSIKNLVGNTTTSNQNDKNNGEYLIFIDGAVSTLEDNLDALYAQNGFQSSFAGGGAGSLDHEAIPCIISNEGLLKNTMQTVETKHKSKTTVTHGWKKKSGPHLVTSVNKTKIKTLNYQPIIQFYTKHNNKYGVDKEKKPEFSTYFTRYPIGIENIDGELLIRDPILHSPDGIEYIGNIPEYSKVHILNGTTDSIRDEVNKELDEHKLKEEKNIDTSFIFSCVNRDDADENHHSKEVEMLSRHLIGSKHVVGALSLGEIATSKSRLLQLHSKTIVVTRLKADA